MDRSDSQPAALSLEPLIPGNEIPGPKGIYVIQQYLGLGLTSLVYKANLKGTDTFVALKVLRSDASDVTAEHFWHEATVLAELRQAGITSVAQLVDRSDKEGAVRFLALEYLDSHKFQPLDRLLEGGPLPGGEQEALSLAAQALELLDRLHTRVGRTYVDMQLKNFWWNQEEQTLKVIDWNHVSSRRDSIRAEELERFGVQDFDGLVHHDLARFGAYFYRMLTGKGAMERGETAYELAERANWKGPFRSSGGSGWEPNCLVPFKDRGPVSVAARQVVIRALCRYPGYSCARDFLIDIRHVQELWTEQIDERSTLADLLERTTRAAEARVGMDQHLLALDEAEARLDMLERRGIEVRDRYWKQLYEVTRGVSQLWGSGLLYYKADQYAEAARKWEEEARAQGRADLWRWVVLAKTGMTNPKDFAIVRQALEDAVEALGKVDPAGAQREFSRVTSANPWIRESAAMMIGWEIDAALKVESGRESEAVGDEKSDPQDWNEAATAYRQAHEELERISLEPYRLALRRERNWEDLVDRAERLERRRDVYSRIGNEISSIRKALETDFKTGLASLRTALVRTPDHQEMVQFCWTYAESLSDTRPRDALQIVDAVRLWAKMSEDDQARWESLHRQVWEQICFREFDLLASRIEEAARQYNWPEARRLVAGIPSAVRGTERHRRLQDALQSLFKSLYEQRHFGSAEEVHHVLALVDPAGLEARMADLQVVQSQITDRKSSDFVRWITEKYICWDHMRRQYQPGEYAEIVTQMETSLQEMERLYADLAKTEDYQKIRRELQADKESLQHQLEEWQGSHNRLTKAEGLLREALEEIGRLTPESLQLARRYLNQAQEALGGVLPAWESSRQEQLRVWMQNGLALADYLETPRLRLASQDQKMSIVGLVREARESLEEMKARLKKPDTPRRVDEVLTRAIRLCRAANRSIEQDIWEQRLPVREGHLLPALTELTREVANWQTMLPFSVGEDAYPGFLEGKRMPAPPHRWALWVLAALGLVIGLAALGMAVMAYFQLPLPFPPSPTPTATMTLTATPTPTNTPSPTHTPTFTPTPAPPLDAVGFAWEDVTLEGVPLYDMPSLTLRPTAGWAFNIEVITSTQVVTQLPVIAPDRQEWALEIVVVDPDGSLEVQAGRGAPQAEGGILWRPDEAQRPLLPGEYSVFLRASAGGVERDSLQRRLVIEESPLRVVLLQPMVRREAERRRCTVDETIGVGTILEVLGRADFGDMTMLRVRVQGQRPLYWVPTGEGGVMDGESAYVKPEDSRPLQEALSTVPVLPNVQEYQCSPGGT